MNLMIVLNFELQSIFHSLLFSSSQKSGLDCEIEFNV